MILESLSNYDLGELLGKDEEPQCIATPAEKSNSKHQAASICTVSNDIISKRNVNTDFLVLEDIDDSDLIDSQIFTRNDNMLITQAISQEQLLESFNHLESAKAATTISEKSIQSTKESSGSQSSRLRRFASNISRVMSNKFRKLCRPTRVERLSKPVDKKNYENQDEVVDRSTSTQHLLKTPSTTTEFVSDA